MRDSRQRGYLVGLPGDTADSWQAVTGTDGVPLTAPDRVLRLIMAAGAVAVGLCVVLAMVALVIRFDGGQVRNVANTELAAHHRASQRDLDRKPGPGAAGAILASYIGNGSGERGPFDVRAASPIGLAWSYRCPAGLAPGFVLGQAAAPASRATVLRRTARTGRGTTWVSENAGDHVLVVVSDCAWEVRVLRR